jgi:hypothetical protein
MAAEAAVMNAVADAVPVPRIIDRRELGGDTAVLLERLPGLTAADLALREPSRARDAGLTCGQVHARLAMVAAPAGLRTVPGAPVPAGRGSPATEPQPRVLHLDLHPFNILLGADGALAGVLDWANAAAGDPVYDRARTWAILTLDPAARARQAHPGWRLLSEGWMAANELGDVPAGARAWACEFMLSDLTRRYAPADLAHVSQALNQSRAALAMSPASGGRPGRLRLSLGHERERLTVRVAEERHPFLDARVMTVNHVRRTLEFDPACLQFPVSLVNAGHPEIQDGASRYHPVAWVMSATWRETWPSGPSVTFVMVALPGAAIAAFRVLGPAGSRAVRLLSAGTPGQSRRAARSGSPSLAIALATWYLTASTLMPPRLAI